MRGGIAAASVANDMYAQVTAPSPYHHSTSQQHHCTITTQCTITVPSLYHHCSITVPSLYHHCSITVPSLYHHCSITVPSLYHHCSITVPSLYQCRFYIVFIYVVHIIAFSTYIQIMCNEEVLCGCTSATVMPATVVHVHINNVCDPPLPLLLL